MYDVFNNSNVGTYPVNSQNIVMYYSKNTTLDMDAHGLDFFRKGQIFLKANLEQTWSSGYACV